MHNGEVMLLPSRGLVRDYVISTAVMVIRRMNESSRLHFQVPLGNCRSHVLLPAPVID